MSIKIGVPLNALLSIGISVCDAGPVPVSVLFGVCSDLAGANPVQLTDISKPGDLVLGVPNDNDRPGGEAPTLAIATGGDGGQEKHLH